MSRTPLVDPTPEPTTEALVVRARDGDRRAYEEVYRRSAGRVYAVCLRMCRDQEHAEELTQDVFVRAWQKLGTFRSESQFSTWLHRLAVNLVLQDRRSRARRSAKELVTDDLSRYEAHAKVAMPGTRIDLERAIATLPDGAREVLLLRDVQGYKYREVADMLGVAVGTVKAQVHRARALMRMALER